MGELVNLPQNKACAFCSCCKSPIKVGEEFKAVTVSTEVFTSPGTIEVLQAKGTHVFCMGCAQAYDFRRITIAESGIMTRKESEEMDALLTEAERNRVAKALDVNPASLSHEQINDWLLAEHADWLHDAEAKGN
ncbi:MAG: hypothetical protein EPN26_17025 [Rhodospirillales bacterium]|nr:MAG: hypothetical protein EPN26_17025 [Rhodospirillales bacterium]